MIDSIDLQIMKILGQKGRKSNVDLAKQIGIPNNTVGQRIKRLTETGVITFSCEIIPKQFKEIIIVMSGIIINGNRENMLNELNKLPNVLFVLGITGRYDFMVVLVADSTEMINKILSKINIIKGVVHTESFIGLENSGLLIRSDKFSHIFKDTLLEKTE